MMSIKREMEQLMVDAYRLNKQAYDLRSQVQKCWRMMPPLRIEYHCYGRALLTGLEREMNSAECLAIVNKLAQALWDVGELQASDTPDYTPSKEMVLVFLANETTWPDKPESPCFHTELTPQMLLEMTESLAILESELEEMTSPPDPDLEPWILGRSSWELQQTIRECLADLRVASGGGVLCDMIEAHNFVMDNPPDIADANTNDLCARAFGY